jgi:hypothetical protein
VQVSTHHSDTASLIQGWLHIGGLSLLPTAAGKRWPWSYEVEDGKEEGKDGREKEENKGEEGEGEVNNAQETKRTIQWRLDWNVPTTETFTL